MRKVHGVLGSIDSLWRYSAYLTLSVITEYWTGDDR